MKRIIGEETENRADQTAKSIKVKFVDSVRVKAILEAGRSRIYNERKETLLDSGVVLNFLSKYNGDRVSVLTSDSAKIDDKTNDMFAFGKVKVVSDSTNTVLTTSVLEYSDSKKKLYSNVKVRIENNFEIINGIGFESDLNLDNYKIYQVKGIKKKNG